MADYEAIANLEPGSEIQGGFVLREVLGRGGAGVVFEAWDALLRRFVALKLPLSEIAATTLVTEAQALAAFRHDGLPTVHVVGHHDGIPFLVLERLRGHTLYDVILRHSKENPLPWREGIHYLSEIAEILQVLHRANLVHRDVKPENIMVCPNGRVVLLDLGIVEQERYFDNAKLSGTPAYVAPEVLAAEVIVGGGHYLDIYSLGVVAFELFSGQLPYRAEDLNDLFAEVIRAPIPRLREYCSELPEALDKLVLSMMAKSPFDRPDSVDAVLHRLRAVSEGRSLHGGGLSLSVIMADDDPDYLDLLKTCVDLLDYDIDIRVAVDGAAALKMVRERPPDLLIVDLEMPVMNGLELCMYVHGMDEARETLIVVMSGKARPEDRALLSELGVIDFIEKATLDLKTFIARLNTILSRTKATKWSSSD